jgi:surfeit locus 1 family protein
MSDVQKRFQRPTLTTTLWAAAMFIFLLGLGTWQVYRLQWKEALLAQIHERTTGEAVALPQAIDDPEDWNYRKAVVTGTFEHDKEIHLLANRGAGRLGYDVITPLKRADGGYVLVDRGWVPEQYRDPSTRPDGQVTGEQTVTGIMRRSFEKPLLVPENKPEQGLWLYANIPEMEGFLGLDTLPMFLQADDTPNPGGLPQGGQTRINDIPNNHLQYAITWYGIALALLVIFIVYHRRPVGEENKG